MEISIICTVIAIILLSNSKTFSQDEMNSHLSSNKPSSFEKETVMSGPSLDPRLESLEQLHKRALENNNIAEAERLRDVINSLLPDDNKFFRAIDNSSELKTLPEPPQTD